MTIADDTQIPVTDPPSEETAVAPPKRERIFRHSAATRITHWINLLCVTMLLFTGLQIFNAHPRLYWGQYGANADRPFIAMEARHTPDGHLIGVTTIGALRIETTGVFGASPSNGQLVARGFPEWLTLPSSRNLAVGRNLHFFFAWFLAINGLIYVIASSLSGHLRRDLYLRREELKPRHLLADVWSHIKLHVPRGEESKRYNTLQKIAYLSVIFLLLPLMILTGMTMSPAMNSAFPFLLDIFGGRQSARTIHFIVAWSLVLFAAVHLFEIFLVGVFNEVRSMITGWYDVKPEKHS